ncbi:MAG: hypothetical protein D6788_05800 [Planctomycetota bacterium]|nr:MAG: hypothetical protein D6788_05800 [Planctomycetota bacterium]
MADTESPPISQMIGAPLPGHLAARRQAQRHDRIIRGVGIALAVAGVIGAGVLLPPINAIRKDRQFVIDPEHIGTLPADLALLGKLGTFRALAIDWASIRAERLKEEGKYYEALKLHETICSLAPRFPTVWVYAAWNMAYNISVAQYTPEDRWRWVNKGIKILRDEGIRYNPRSVSLYKELAWIYWHKIGDFLDDHHLDYKRALAVEMEEVLGPPPVTLTDDEYFAWFKKIVDAPRDLDALIDKDEDVARLVFQLETLALKPDISLLKFVARHIRPELRVRTLQKEQAELDPRDRKRMQLITDPENADALDRLLAAVRSRVLRETYKFDLDKMYALMEEYGPLDWRNGFAHALYWSSVGDDVSQGVANIKVADQLNNARFILFALQNLVVRGRMTLWPDFDDAFASYIEMTPDTRFIPYLYDAYMRFGKKYFGDDERFVEGTPGPVYMTGFVTNMHVWIQLLYLDGGERNMKLAEQYYLWLRKYNKAPDGSTQKRYLVTLDEFVMKEITDSLLTFKASSALVRNLIRRALKQFSLGQNTLAVRSLLRARYARKVWMKGIENDVRERRKMQPLDVMVRDELESYLTHPNIAPLYKASLWKNLMRTKPELCQAVYDRLRPYFVRLCDAQQPAWDVERAFSEPAGMEAYRARIRAQRGKRPGDIGAEEGTSKKE